MSRSKMRILLQPKFSSMKQFLLLLLILNLVPRADAQVVIDGNGFLTPGTQLTYENASPLWLMGQDPEAISGEDVIWDVTQWQSGTADTETYYALDTLSVILQLYFSNSFINPDHFSTVYMPVADGMIDLPVPLDISAGKMYYRVDETGFYQTGSSFEVSGFPLATPNDTVDRIYKFPLQYGDSASSVLSYLIEVPTLGAYGQHATRNSYADGSGQLLTPYGTYDVVRVRSVRHITDTLYIGQLETGQIIDRPEQIDYAWLSPDVPGPVFQMTVIAGQVTSARLYQDSTATRVEDLRFSEVTLAPNPAKDAFAVLNPSFRMKSIEMYTATGRLVFQQEMPGQQIDISDFKPGLYLVRVKGFEGEDFIRKISIIE